MNTRKKNLYVFVVMTIFVALCILSLHTFFIGFNLVMYSNDVVESEQYADYNYMARESANNIYDSVNESRDKLYNSSNPYTRWLSNMNNNLVRVPLGLIIIASPFLFISGVKKYNLNKRRKNARMK